jgi:hypothetical protein
VSDYSAQEVNGPVTDIRLAGIYLAIEAASPDQCGGGATFCPTDTEVDLWNLASGSQSRFIRTAEVDTSQSLLLSPSGVAAWITHSTSALGLTGSFLRVLSLSSGEATVDQDPSTSALADVELFRCTAGCAPNTTIVAWTNGGTQRYTTVVG